MFVPQIKQTFMSRSDCSMGLVESMAGCLAFKITFGEIEWSLALRGMITFRQWVNIKRKMGQCRTAAFGVSAMCQTAVRSCRQSRTLGQAF